MDTNTDLSFHHLLHRAACGSADAITTLVENHGEAVCRVVRRRLHRLMRSQFDTMDFAQIVWASILDDLDQLVGFHRPEELEAYLSQIATCKVVDACRQRLMLQKNNINREYQIDQATASTPIEIRSGEPTPSRNVQAREEWENLLRSLPKRYRDMVILRSEGHSFVAIAEKMGVNERTVRRVFKNLGQRTSE